MTSETAVKPKRRRSKNGMKKADAISSFRFERDTYNDFKDFVNKTGYSITEALEKLMKLAMHGLLPPRVAAEEQTRKE